MTDHWIPRSNWLCALVALIALTGILMLWLSALNVVLQGVLTLAVLLKLWHFWRYQQGTELNEWMLNDIMPDSIVTRYIIILRFSAASRRRAIIMLPDNVSNAQRTAWCFRLFTVRATDKKRAPLNS